MVLYVGTSGWQYRDWRGTFYPADRPASRWLELYADAFATVEVNNTFYRLPERSTFEAWAERTPADFVFVVKASRYLTHVRRLQDPKEPVARLLDHARGLGPKLGPVLLQLPPTLRAEPARLDDVLAAFPSSVRVAVEPRHESWFAEATYDVLARHDAALCLTDRAGQRGPIVRTAEWTFLRMHEGTASPPPCYGDRALTSWAERLTDRWPDPCDAYVFFNNDPGACAPRNAARFAAIAARTGLRPTRTPDPGEISVAAR